MANFVQHLYQQGEGPHRFAVSMPLATHWEPSPCERVDCPHYLTGWKTQLDESLPKHQNAAAWIRSGASGRQYRETHDIEGLTVFEFTSGQQCFQTHQVVQSDKPGIYTHDGKVHRKVEDFAEDMVETSEPVFRRIRDRLESQ